MSSFSVNVAKSNLPVAFSGSDDSYVSHWNSLNLYSTMNSMLSGTPFVLMDGPPYANGNAHMGHALNKLLKDLVVRSNWKQGRPVHFTPGWDCHGLPLELAVEKKFKEKPSESFNLLSSCRNLALKSVSKQRKAFKDLGVMADWDSPYLTLSSNLRAKSWNSLKVLLEKDLLSLKKYPVHYCPACASSLAEAELEQVSLPKYSLYFKMKVSEQESLVVWTTTPWTVPMNQAVAYNSSLMYSRFKNDKGESLVCLPSEDLVNLLKSLGFNETDSGLFTDLLPSASSAESPLSKKRVPLLAGSFVEGSRSGLVHLVAAHGVDDFELCAHNGVHPESMLNKHGVFDHVPNNLLALRGLKHTKAAPSVVSFLEEDGLLLQFNESSELQNACWRHKCGTYYNATQQVFLELDLPYNSLKLRVKEKLEESLVADGLKSKLLSMMLNRPAWCLSRQRTWGTPLNLVVNKETGSLNKEKSLKLLSELANGLQPTVALSESEFVFKDVLDVWFDSGNVHNALHSNTVDLVLEGKDQYRGWFQALLWLSVAVNDKLPFNSVLCHGFVLDENRNKLSKSSEKSVKGKNDSPLTLLRNEHGGDCLRLWVASQEAELDPVFSVKKLEEVKKYYSRFRLCLRFLTSNCYSYSKESHEVLLSKAWGELDFEVHRYVLNELSKLNDLQNTAFNQLEFKKALDETYKVFDKLLSNFYFDYLKSSLYLLNATNSTRVMHLTGMHEVLTACFDLLKVFVPFVCEEFYQDYYSEQCNSSVVLETYFERNKNSNRPSGPLKLDWDSLVALRKEVLGAVEPLQQKKEVKARAEVGVSLEVLPRVADDLSLFETTGNSLLTDLFSCSKVRYTKSLDSNTRLNLEVLSKNENYKKCPRCWNYKESSEFLGEVCCFCEKQR